MERIIPFLLYAAIFYFMMRFGCGAHMVHGHHGHQGHDRKAEDRAVSAKDPVCGMTVENGRGYSETFDGAEYRFCSRKCLDRFDTNPQQYAHAS